ncbi:MAG: NfeD family protein [Peptoniphilaceae bacterium]
MKKCISLIVLFIILLPSIAFSKENDVFIIPINGEINSATSNFVKEGIDKAVENNYKAIVFDIDTYGGSVIAAEQIKDDIINSPIKTVAYVNTKAESAGVLISIACEKIYMRSTATIGSAETIPNTEKNISFWRSILRDTAQKRNRNETVIEAMADKDISIDGLVTKGKLVNLTSKESLDYGISDGVIDSKKELVTELGYNIENTDTLEMSNLLKFINFISNPTIATLFIILGMSGFVFELFSPGFGVGGIISIISFFMFFLGNTMVGNSNWYSIAIFILGIVLILIEIAIPGFGIAGISGLIAIILGLILAMETIEIAITSIAISLVITIMFTLFLIKKGMKFKLINKLTLNRPGDFSEKYLSVDHAKLNLGQVGKSLTVLKPTGFIEVEGSKYEAIAYKGFIEKGVDVEVIKIESYKIFVRRID